MAFPVASSLLDACVLGLLNQGDAYGYRLTQQLIETADISESTLYPVLRRLQKEGHLETYDQPMDGRNRRYYRITSQGRAMLEIYMYQWQEYKKKIDHMLAGGNQYE